MRKLLLVGLVLSISAITLFAQKKANPQFLRSDEAVLASPTGPKIAVLNKGQEITPIAEQGDMVKIQITGWIPKSSLVGKPMRALHIMLESKADADAALAELNSSKDFIAVAKARSKGPGAGKGGDLGYFNKGDFDPAIENAISALAIGQISKIVEVGGKFFIFKRIE